MTTAVVGAAGFLGRALTAALRAAGMPTVEFTRATPFASTQFASTRFASPGERPAPALAAASTIYYFASSINPAIAERDPNAVAEDLDRFTSFIRCLDGLDPAPTVVLPSSGGTVYDVTRPPPYDETSATGPRGAYGRAKLAMERHLLDSGHRAVVLRIGNVYGPGQPTGAGQGVIAHWLAAAAKQEPIVVFGDPAASRDYVYIDDVATAFLAVRDAPDAPDAPRIVNIGSGQPTSLAELAVYVAEVVGDVTMYYDSDRGFDVSHTWLDVTLARETLGWTPTVPLREGLRRTWQHVSS